MVANYRADDPELRDALEVAADVVGVRVCWYLGGDFHFRVADDWTVSITPDSAGRVRVTTWLRGREHGTKMAMVRNQDRIAKLVRETLDMALAVV